MKTKYFILFLVLIIFNIIKVNAYTCSYDAKFVSDMSNTYDVSRSFDVEDESIKISGRGFILDSFIDNNSDDAKLIELIKGGCPDYVYMCEHFTTYSRFILDGVTSTDVYSFIINFDLKNSFVETLYPDKNNYAVYTTAITPSDCVIASANESKSTGKIISDLFEYSYIDTIENESEIISWCNIVLKYADYINPCTKSCLDFVEKIKDKPIYNTNMECGLSQKLILYIANIIKWIKYIIPVVVIVLGILDFIKAVGADKEDEIKKAQGNFVKRLIAAALIFIIPFIIEFILEKMGFDSNGCGIIDL